ncbi:hypothetical protein K1719_026800 [Acacia pycnantha]|nr:hypothetical protein K1719_026800 [Acacia pycnantha]
MRSTITGIILSSLSDWRGVKVKVLFLWINILSVTRVDDELKFSVGIASVDLKVFLQTHRNIAFRRRTRFSISTVDTDLCLYAADFGMKKL